MKSLFTILSLSTPVAASLAGTVHALLIQPDFYFGYFEAQIDLGILVRIGVFLLYLLGGSLISIFLSLFAFILREPLAKHTLWFTAPCLVIFATTAVPIVSGYLSLP
ncbi:MAG: hypothetical protein CMO55_12475 [Verrucomicrobiales bacterium]|nr:hypothetical protein [Verrucomicrobiales bacterium]